MARSSTKDYNNINFPAEPNSNIDIEKKEAENGEINEDLMKAAKKDNQTNVTEADKFLTLKEINLKETEIYRENFADEYDYGVLQVWNQLDIETKFEYWAGNYYHMMPPELRNHLW